MSEHPGESLADLIHGATQRLVRSIDAISDEGWGAASLLPGWTRAHVVAHLALNAEALGGVLVGVHDGRAVPMYPSWEQRNADIADLATAAPTVLRDRLLASTTAFGDALYSVRPEQWSATFERLPGTGPQPADLVPGMRWREVEIHHADLGLAYSPADWSESFCTHLLDALSLRAPSVHPFEVYATDLDRTWSCGEGGGPTVSGAAPALGWWLSGRGTGDGLTSNDGRLPGIEAW